jgi:hypothetical protein
MCVFYAYGEALGDRGWLAHYNFWSPPEIHVVAQDSCDGDAFLGGTNDAYSGQPAAAPSVAWDGKPLHERVSERVRSSSRPISIRFRRGSARLKPTTVPARMRQWLHAGAADRYVWWRDRLIFCGLMWCKLATFIMTSLSLQAIICELPEGSAEYVLTTDRSLKCAHARDDHKCVCAPYTRTH